VGPKEVAVRRFWGVLAGAVLAVALEVAVKLVADSVAVPRRYYLVPVGAFVVLVGTQLILTLRSQPAPAGSGQRPAVRPSGGRHTIKGRWHEPSLNMVLAIVMVASASGLVYAWYVVHKAPAGTLIVILLFVLLLAALCLWAALGSRVSLEFSADGVAVRQSLRRTRRLRWDEATNFRADRGAFVADPAEASTWYLHGWDFDESYDVIRICDLWRADIAPAAVEAAVRYWDRARRSQK
jgi:hypothetical protein